VTKDVRRQRLGNAGFVRDALHHSLNRPGRPWKFIIHHKKILEQQFESRRHGDVRKAAWHEKYLNPSPRENAPSAEEWFEQGYYACHYDEALRCYSEAIRRNPKDAAAYYNRGLARRLGDDLYDASEDFSKVIQLDPTNADAYYNRGIVRHDNGDVGGAVKDFSEAILFNPDHANAYQSRGNLRRDKGDLDIALEDELTAHRIRQKKET